jgi:pyruvate formate lyase activating enzyme
MSKVIVVHSRHKKDQPSVDFHKIKHMLQTGLALLAGHKRRNLDLSHLLSSQARIGIKINTIGGRKISTLPATSLALAKTLGENGINEENLVIWDRTNRELKDAGYTLNLKGKGVKIFGTDTAGVGYSAELTDHLNIGSLFSAIQSDYIQESISLAILKDHGLAGVTAGMKNYFGTIHNPNKYHDNNCNPFVAELFDSSPIKSKHRLTILDALTVQYHRGPSYHGQWADNHGALVFSRDPVAADSVGSKIIEKLRAAKGLPSLKEEHREPVYIRTADKMGLGTASLKQIKLIEAETIDRREFIKASACAGLFMGTGMGTLPSAFYAFGNEANLSRVEARYYEKHPDREIKCTLCPRLCKLGDKERGYCGVRENQDGTYYTLVYGKACTSNVDPIEKKPLFHFLPGETALSIASAGCNVNCKFCQNWEISQVRPEQIRHFDLSPAEVVSSAQQHHSPIIAYTYSEPIVFFEYMYDTSVLARKKEIRNAVITGGHIQPEPLKDLLEVVDAVKVDLKSFSQDFYTEYVRGELKPVLDAIKIIAESPIWLEIVYLVIPTLNDSDKEIKRLSRWILDEIGPDVPVHFTRFQPMYLLKNLPPTPQSTVEKARNIARKEGINYVYIGNIPGHEAENTYCPNCHKLSIERRGYRIRQKNIKNGKCKFCSNPIPGVWT